MRDIRVMLAHIEETTPDAFSPEKLSNKQQGENLRSGISAVQYGTNNAGLAVFDILPALPACAACVAAGRKDGDS
ncbi:hypothetical protein [Thiorhodospira sibirica]|uniref:hypothetical protein n=1 Tax=Thiorhodospira sibirica TaxID=154347 RepID=UPI00022C3401|nr:hypothetical protein [Thiorhodospira sibirica]